MAPPGTGVARPKTKRSEGVFTRHQPKNIAREAIRGREVPRCGDARGGVKGEVLQEPSQAHLRQGIFPEGSMGDMEPTGQIRQREWRAYLGETERH